MLQKPILINVVYDWTEDSEYVSPTPSVEAKQAFHYVQEAGHFYCQPHYLTEREHLDSYLLVYTVAGTGNLQYRGREYPLSPGCAFLIDCREYQRYRTDPIHLWEILWVHCNGGMSREYFEAFWKRNNSPVIDLNEENVIPELLTRLLELYRRKDTFTEIKASQLIHNLWMELLLTSTAKGQSSIDYSWPSYMTVIQEYLEMHFQEEIGLDQLALNHSISKYHMIREFKQYSGLTPHQYLLNIRISKAKDLLKHTEASVSDVAFEVGFEHTSHFIQMFKKQEDMTPLSYRKKWRLRE